MTRAEMIIEVMAGRMKWPESGGASPLPVDSRSTRPELGPTKSWASQGDYKRGPTTFRDGRAVPDWVLEAEKADGIKRTFIRRGDFSGFVKPGPTEKPSEVQDFERRSGESWGWDYGRSMWRPVADFQRTMPTQLKEQADRLFPDPADVHRPVYDEESDTWDWPKLPGSGKGLAFGQPTERPDLKGMDYWQDPERFGINQPLRVTDGAGSLHSEANAMTAEQAAAEKGPGAA